MLGERDIEFSRNFVLFRHRQVSLCSPNATDYTPRRVQGNRDKSRFFWKAQSRSGDRYLPRRRAACWRYAPGDDILMVYGQCGLSMTKHLQRRAAFLPTRRMTLLVLFCG